MLAVVAGYIQPAGSATFDRHHPYPAYGGRLSYLGVFNRNGVGIDGVCGIQHQVILHIAGSDLPVGNAAAIRTPTESIPATKFFFVSPIKSAIDDFIGTIFGQLGDFLIVGINDDASVKRLNKGPERPINDEEARAGVVAALRVVDAVVVFGEDTPFELIQLIEPDILVKGGDYDAAERDPRKSNYIVGSNETLERGGEVVAIPVVEGYSTTSIVQKMRQ